MILRHLLPALALASVCMFTASAQISADLRGRVLDPAGLAVPNATIELTQIAANTHIVTVTSGSGYYSFTNLTPGAYQLDVRAPGFARLTRSGVHAIVGQTVDLDLKLSLNDNQQTVEVTADAAPLQSATSNVQTNIAGPTVVAMPLNTRNFVQLATLAPGVELPPGTVLPRINGGRPAPTNISLTASPPCNPSRARLSTSPSSMTFRHSPSRPTTFPPNSADSTAESSTSRLAQDQMHFTVLCSNSSAMKTSTRETSSQPHEPESPSTEETFMAVPSAARSSPITFSSSARIRE